MIFPQSITLSLLVLLLTSPPTAAFTPVFSPTSRKTQSASPSPINDSSKRRGTRRPSTRMLSPPNHRQTTSAATRSSTTTTQLNALLDVPDYFFTITFPLLSVFLAFSKNVARSRLEERAWEQRLEEARERKMAKDPSLTELELRRSEAAAEWSAYGKSSSDSDKERMSSSGRRGRGVMVQEREEEADDDRRRYTMTDDEISQFEQEFGIEYDPYYDDAYTEDELPEDLKYRVDRVYGDRIYEDGEVFYKDKATGLYYRQGAQPRTQKFSWKL